MAKSGRRPESALAELDGLMPQIYQELRALAYQMFQGERADHTLQPTALVHEAYIRLAAQHGSSWRNRGEFIGSAVQMIRRILVDHARKHLAAKRGGGRAPVPLDENVQVAHQQDTTLVDIDEALTRLAELDARKSRIVDLRFFGGLSEEETAELLGLSPRTVRREGRLARAWLRRQLEGGHHHDT